ncbi:Putative pentatricopeptide repeat-containing protein At1g68930 [Linum perenne]
MHVEGQRPTQYSMGSVLRLCSVTSSLQRGEQIHGYALKTGNDVDVFVATGLVDMYAKCMCISEAESLFQMVADAKSHATWTAMLTGYSRNGECFQAMEFFRLMRAEGVEINQFTFPSVLTACAAVLAGNFGVQVHGCIVKSGFGANIFVQSALVDMYAKQGKMDLAVAIFNNMEDRDVVSWTSLVVGYSHNRSFEDSINLFCEMKVTGIHLDQLIVANILSCCAELTIMEFGQQVHGTLVKSGLESSVSVDNSLVTMYAKCGAILDANRVFDAMQTRNVISWTALIVGYAQNGKGMNSLLLYEQMLSAGIDPDYITFIGLLFACSHTGNLEKGRSYFNSMDSVYGIKPGPEHYACMIDLFGRSGKLTEAKQILDQMTVQPDATVWKSLLATCRIHKELELGQRAANNLFELEPNNSMPYVMLSNMYASTGRWEDAAGIRKLMKSRGISKEPGSSWTHTNGKVHTFVSEDRSHPMMKEIYLKVDEVIAVIKEAGYVPDMDYALHDMEKEGKELGLAYHSEKLAVAFALLVMPIGAPIRIYKNLRVCGDCHAAFKYVSRLYGRCISLRDSNCFHHFVDGKCSCGDYW